MFQVICSRLGPFLKIRFFFHEIFLSKCNKVKIFKSTICHFWYVSWCWEPFGTIKKSGDFWRIYGCTHSPPNIVYWGAGRPEVSVNFKLPYQLPNPFLNPCNPILMILTSCKLNSFSILRFTPRSKAHYTINCKQIHLEGCHSWPVSFSVRCLYLNCSVRYII